MARSLFLAPRRSFPSEFRAVMHGLRRERRQLSREQAAEAYREFIEIAARRAARLAGEDFEEARV